MDIYAYLYVRGDEFSPKAFQSQLPEPLRGLTKFHRRVRKGGGVEFFAEHWKSHTIEAPDHFEAMTKLHDLVSQLHPALLEIRNDDLTVRAVLVSHCRSREACHGFYVPPETTKLFAEVGASLDIDQYYHVNSDDETETEPSRQMRDESDAMDIYVYLYVRGDEFSPKDFQSRLPEPLRGITKFHKRVQQGGAVEWFNEHWMSREMKAPDHFEAMTKLHDLVSQLRPELLAIQGNEVVISAKLASYYRSEEAFHGFYVPPETVSLFAEVGASLDIDQYDYISDGEETETEPS